MSGRLPARMDKPACEQDMAVAAESPETPPHRGRVSSILPARLVTSGATPDSVSETTVLLRAAPKMPILPNIAETFPYTD